MHALAALLVFGSILTPSLPVDFRFLVPTMPAAPGVTPPDPVGQGPLRSDPPTSGQQPARQRSTRPGSAYSVAHGFGTDVPLRFAARQIVPPGIDVVFAPGINPESSVSWRGGVPWNRALQSAIRPLGLRMTHHGRTVTIVH